MNYCSSLTDNMYVIVNCASITRQTFHNERKWSSEGLLVFYHIIRCTSPYLIISNYSNFNDGVAKNNSLAEAVLAENSSIALFFDRLGHYVFRVI